MYTVLYQLSYRRNSPTGTRTQDPRLKRLTRIAVYPQCWCHLTSDPTTKPPTGLEPAILQLRAGCLNQIWPRRLGMYLYSAQQRCLPPTGFEPATLRLKVLCSKPAELRGRFQCICIALTKRVIPPVGVEPTIFWLEARRPSRLGYRP